MIKKLIYIVALLVIQIPGFSQNSTSVFRKHPYLIYPGVVGEMTILWQTESTQSLQCTVNWGTSETYGNSYSFTTSDPFNQYTVENLLPQTRYYYQVIVSDPDYVGEDDFESNFFSAPLENENEIKFNCYGDTRGPSDLIPGLHLYHDDVSEEIVNKFTSDSDLQTFLIHVGDWACKGLDDFWQDQYFNIDFSHAVDLRSKLPIQGALGNHELWEDEGALNYRKYWPYNYSSSRFYYSFDYGPIHFCVIDQKDQNTNLNTEGDYSQKAWIQSDLINSNKRWKALVFHPPVYVGSKIANIYNVEKSFYDEICNDFDTYGVNMLLNGHEHFYSDWLVNGVHHLTIGRGGGPYGSEEDSDDLDPFQDDIIRWAWPNNFANFEVTEDYIKVKVSVNTDGLPNFDWDGLDEFIIPHHFTIKSGENITWEDLGCHYYADVITVENGGELTIKGDIEFQRDGRIIVERGGKLTIDDALLTCLNDYGNDTDVNSWHGIEVQGNSNEPQLATEQGWVEINDATIQKSIFGIYTNKADPENNGEYVVGYTGGIIRAEGANFINNEIAVYFHSYPTTSVSYIKDCVFETNTEYIEDTPYPEQFIKAVSINGVNIINSDFINNVTSGNDQKGLFSLNSQITVKGKCTTGSPCTNWDYGLFQNLDYGIYVTTSSSSNNLSLIHTNFDNNYNGVYVSGMENLSLTECNFTTSTNNAGGYGLYLDACTGYTVEENYFVEGGQDAIGIIVNNSGHAANEIYRNDFLDLKFGIIAQNENRSYKNTSGLELKCNDYENTGYDHVVTWEGLFLTPGAGIAAHQGSNLPLAEEMAGNLFFIPDGPVNGDYDDMNNGANDFIYYYPENVLSGYEDVEPKDFTDLTITAEAVPFLPNWDYDNGCPPEEAGGGGGGETEGLRSAVASAEEEIAATSSILAVLVDGGDTQALNSEVETSLPPESMQVYNELMGSSPYLSDSVVSSAIEKEDVLPNAMIRDIMVANPQTAKSNELMVKLDERWDPLPDYMKAQILQGKDIVSLKEELESHLASHKQKKAKAFNRLVRYFLMDTLNPVASSDSLVMLLQEDGELGSKYSLAMLHLDRGEIQDGLTVLNSIAGQYNLQGDELPAHQDMLTYYNLLSNLKSDSKSILEVDGDQIGQLLTMEAAQQGMAAIYARSILLALNEIEYQEPIILPDMLKSSEAEQAYHELLETQPPKQLEVYPNPSDDYVIIQYKADKEIPGSVVEVTNMNGSIVKSITIANLQDQVVVDTQSWKAGVYIATLNVEGNPVESVKFTIVK